MAFIYLFFAQCWEHRHNWFIAIGGLAAFFLFLTVALTPVPWIPPAVMSTIAFLTGTFSLATIALMLYYIVKYIFVGCIFLIKKLFGTRSEGESDLRTKLVQK